MKNLKLKKRIPAALMLFALLALPFHGSSRIDYSDSFIHFGINGLSKTWGHTSASFASLQRAANGFELTLTAGERAYNDTIRITLRQITLPPTEEEPWERLRNSSEITILYAGRTYRGFVTIFLDQIPEVGGMVTGTFESCTLTWVGMDETISVAPGNFSLVRTR
jgi:hypothetical protein